MSFVYFITQGCSANFSDTEIMKGILLKEGYEITEYLDQADVVVFNTCTVKGPTESFFWKKIKELKSKGKKLVVTGCIPQAENDLSKFEGLSLLGIYQIDRIAEITQKTLNGETVINLAKDDAKRVNLPKVRSNPIVEIVQISIGCLDSCTYCKTKHAKGHLTSFDPEEILSQIQCAINDGVREIWLTSQDNGAYGVDIGTNLVNLLKRIGKINGNFRVRLGMANPNHILHMLDEIIWILKDNKKFFRFLHIPIQSGSNKVLKDMKRNYTVEDFVFIYRRLKDEMPDITISTDIICGYPTETEADFSKSLEIIEKYPVDVLNRSRFWPRDGTPAAKLKQLQGSIVKDRSRRLEEMFKKTALKNNNKWQDWQGLVLVDEVSDSGDFIARNYAYRPLVIKSNLELFGKWVEARVFKTTSIDLRANILDVED